MNYRRHGRKPTIALWMLVAIIDVALVVAAVGLLTSLLIVFAVAVLAGGVIAARSLGRRARPEPAKVVVRRRS